MAGSVQVTVECSPVTGLRRYTFAWVSEAVAAGAATIWLDGRRAPMLEGVPVRLVTRPDVGNQPTALYDVRLYDEHDHDLLGGVGDDRSNTAVETAGVYVSIHSGERYSESGTIGLTRFEVSAAGNAKAGTACLYVRPFGRLGPDNGTPR